MHVQPGVPIGGDHTHTHSHIHTHSHTHSHSHTHTHAHSHTHTHAHSHAHTHTDTEGGDGTSEVYEEPVPSRPSTSNGSLPGMTPPGSRENSGSGVEYMEANRANIRGLPEQQGNGDISMEWSSVYQQPPGSTKLKVAQLEGISIKGPLEKLGGKSHRTWQRRYCVLAGPLMYFYEKETSKTYNNFIMIPSFSVEYLEKMSDKKHFAFKLTQQDHAGKKKDYCFRSTSSENRDKWVTAMKKVIDVANVQKTRSAVTLPRLPSRPGGTPSPAPQEKRRSLSLGPQEEPQELYEPVDPVMGAGDDENLQDDYVPVSPEAQIKEDFESSEEYIDVDPGAREDEPTEVYEEPPIMLEEDRPPPPPTSPPPGPPRDHPFPPSTSPIPPPPLRSVTPEPVPPPVALPPKPQVALPPRSTPPIAKKPAPLPPQQDKDVDTNKVYIQPVNGISLEKVFVSLWDFSAGEKDEINLKRGDLVLVKDPKENADWWFGELLDEEATRKLGKSGFFPRTYASHAFEAIS